MSDPYLQQPSYPAAPAPGVPAGGTAAYYAPPDSVYQNPPYDYDPQQQPYAQHEGPGYPPYEYNNHPQYGSQYDLSQNSVVPRSFLPPVVPPPPMPQPTEYLSPVSAEFPPPPGGLLRRGSNADYYDQHPSDPNSTNPDPNNTNKPEDADRSAAPNEADENERNLPGALLGGATGYYLGHKKSHGFLGAVGGALLGNYLGDKMSESGGDGDGDDDAHSSHHSHDGRRRRRRHRHSHSHGSHSHSSHSHSGSHGHGHLHHHHHHHHHGDGYHGHRRHRSRSRHSNHSHGGSDGW